VASTVAMKHPSLLVLVRHAESELNLAKKGAFFADRASREAVRSTADHRAAITELGRRQARAAGELLRARFERFDAVYHSGYARTVQTLDEIKRAWPDGALGGAPMRSDLFIRERDGGHGWGMTLDEHAGAFPYLEAYWATTGPFFARPPGGESVAQLCERVQRFLDRIEARHDGERVLVVTHGVVMRAFRYLLEGWTYEQAEAALREPSPRNASVTWYESSGGALRLVDYDVVQEP
jgi:probable phosphoglycerate mutase